MRLQFALAAFATLALAQNAAAAPVSLAPVSLSPAFQTELTDELGEREGVYLQRAVSDAVARELTRRGANVAAGAPIVVELAIVDAQPNRPTFEQLGARTGLSMSSISVGGAELNAVLRGADGRVLSEVSHRNYSPNLAYVIAAGTWSDAHRAIRQFARKVAVAYVAQAAN